MRKSSVSIYCPPEEILVIFVNKFSISVFSLVSSVAMVHAVRDAMRSLKKTGTDFSSAKGMDPKAFFEVMGLNEVVSLDARAGGKAFEVV